MKQPRMFAPILAMTASAAFAWSPIGFGIVGVDGGQMPATGDSVYGFSFALFSSEFDTMYGISVATLGLSADDAAGIQVSGGKNSARRAPNGVMQVAALANGIEDGGEGIQIAGIINDSKDFVGLQVAALLNILHGTSAGVQIGTVNATDEALSFEGVQVGVINLGGNIPSTCDLTGLQIGTFNCAEDFKGVQIGACNSVCGDFKGVQIGAFNFVIGDFKGVQIGAFNLVDSSDIAFLPVLRAAL